MPEISFQSRSPARATSTDCRYYRYRSLTQLWAGKQPQEFKDILSDLDILVLRKLLPPSHQTRLTLRVHMAATREAGEARSRAERGLMMLSVSAEDWHQSCDAKTARHKCCCDVVVRPGRSPFVWSVAPVHGLWSQLRPPYVWYKAHKEVDESHKIFMGKEINLAA